MNSTFCFGHLITARSHKSKAVAGCCKKLENFLSVNRLSQIAADSQWCSVNQPADIDLHLLILKSCMRYLLTQKRLCKHTKRWPISSTALHAQRLCSECPIYLRGRTNFLGATGETLAAQRLWLKNEAAKYLDDLCINTESSPPSEHWYSITTAARKRNLVQIFFLDAKFHRECRLLPPETLPPSEHFRINRSI